MRVPGSSGLLALGLFSSGGVSDWVDVIPGVFFLFFEFPGRGLGE